MHQVCRCIVIQPMPIYIQIPTGDMLKAVQYGFFHKWGFPQCVGAIDGTHIPILAPSKNPIDYFNHKGYHSIVMQALVDHNYRFMDIYVGWLMKPYSDTGRLSPRQHNLNHRLSRTRMVVENAFGRLKGR